MIQSHIIQTEVGKTMLMCLIVYCFVLLFLLVWLL